MKWHCYTVSCSSLQRMGHPIPRYPSARLALRPPTRCAGWYKPSDFFEAALLRQTRQANIGPPEQATRPCRAHAVRERGRILHFCLHRPCAPSPGAVLSMSYTDGVNACRQRTPALLKFRQQNLQPYFLHSAFLPSAKTLRSPSLSHPRSSRVAF